ncbi:MAG: glycosyl hydrolase family 18 [Actinobacteria bacterium]|nr:glycosyl hydrolase family 18 [Actinomycetota bacterium]
MSDPGRRLSPLRILVVLIVLAGLGGLGMLAWDRGRDAVDDLSTSRSGTWFAPYVDVTLQPLYAFEDAAASPAPTHVLAFVVADGEDPCTPTWGTQYDLAGAARELDLDRRIARLRERGRDVLISFGGVTNQDLSVGCVDQDRLVGAYRDVVERYQASVIDLDIEGALLADRAALARQARAIRTLQSTASADRPLQVWVTLPVTPDGLTPGGVSAVTGMLTEGVELAGVNVMAMDYGGSKPADVSMGDAAARALEATHAQIDAAYRDSGATLTAEEIWSRLGVTVMVGRNDVSGELLSLDDARSVAHFARRSGAGRVSIWSANRDQACGKPGRAGWEVLPTCSGVDQKPGQFSGIFLDQADGVAVDSPARAVVVTTAGRDGIDPTGSPYPAWRSDREYRTGEKVVWQRTVYIAKWWTRGDAPDTPATRDWDTPWRVVGPVLPGDARASADPANPSRWSADAVYLRGDRVRHDGYLYEAAWRTQDEEPELDPERPDAAPWIVVGRAVTDVPPVFEHYSKWRGNRGYRRADRVELDGFVYQAKRAVEQGERPEPTPARPGRAAWTLIGRVQAEAS